MLQRFGFTHIQTFCTLLKYKLHNHSILSTMYWVPKNKRGLETFSRIIILLPKISRHNERRKLALQTGFTHSLVITYQQMHQLYNLLFKIGFNHACIVCYCAWWHSSTHWTHAHENSWYAATPFTQYMLMFYKLFYQWFYLGTWVLPEVTFDMSKHVGAMKVWKCFNVND
jgi:hypothetical protein